MLQATLRGLVYLLFQIQDQATLRGLVYLLFQIQVQSTLHGRVYLLFQISVIPNKKPIHVRLPNLDLTAVPHIPYQSRLLH